MSTNTTSVLEIPKTRGKYGEGSIRQIGPKRWQISYYDNQGRRRRESFRTEDRARRKLAAAIALRDTGKLEPQEGRVKINSLSEVYKTYAKNSAPKSYSWIELVWRCHLEPFFGGKLADRISSDDLEAYRKSRLDAGAAASTVNREMTVLKATLNHAAKADPPKLLRVPRFPERLREPNPRSGFLKDNQYDAFQSNIKVPWLRAALAVSYNYGFRRSELIGLRVSQIDLKNRMIHLLPGTTKNDKGRAVAMTPEVYEVLAECVKDKKPGDAVFTRPNGKPVRDFRKLWRTLAKQSGVPGLLLHDLRRAAIRNMIRGGVSKHVAKRISGHTTDAVFDRYDITDETDLVDAAEKIAARRAQASEESGKPDNIGHKLGTEFSGRQ
jgi:integrase